MIVKGKKKNFIIREKTNFSNNNSLALKGIAVIMLVFYHCFLRPGRYAAYSVSFFPLGEELTISIIKCFKICVSIFAFVSGYGLMISFRKLLRKYGWTKEYILKWVVQRLIKLLSGFWIIVILYYTFGQIVDERVTNTFYKSGGILYGTLKLVLDFFALSNFFRTPEFCGTRGYMGLAILFVISVPIFTRLFEKYGYTLVIIGIIAIPRILNIKFVGNSYISFILIVVLGMIFSREELLTKIANFKILKKQLYLNKLLKFIIGTGIIYVLYRLYNILPVEKFWEIKFAIIPAIFIWYVYEFVLDVPIIKQILEYFGKHSMNIFLIHSLLRTVYLNSFIYSQKHFIIIAGVLFIISLILSILLEIFKKLIRYDKIIDKLQLIVRHKIDSYYEKRKIKVIEIK